MEDGKHLADPERSSPAPAPAPGETLDSYTPTRPLLLATDYPPDAGGGGAVILRSLLADDAPADAGFGEAGRGLVRDSRARVFWASLAPGRSASGPAAPGAVLGRGSARWPRLLRRRSGLADAALAGDLADEILERAREIGAPAIWAVLHGTMVHVTARLVERDVLPVHATVHDDPPFGVALLSRRYVGMVPWIARDFARAVRGARSIDVISAGMAERYRRKFGVAAEVVHRGLGQPVRPGPPHEEIAGMEIGVLGNTYGFAQLPRLAEALGRAARVAGVRPRIVVFGQGEGARLAEACARSVPGGHGVDVEVLGHLDEEAALARLRGCFLLYLNYPFGARAEVLRTTSFPTKLSTYLMAARPLLVHAPAASSIAPLRDRGYETFTFWWDDVEIAHGAETMERAWRDPSAHQSQHRCAEALRLRFYDAATNRSRLFRQLNALVPPVQTARGAPVIGSQPAQSPVP